MREFNEYQKNGIVILKNLFNKNEINKTKKKPDEIKKKTKKKSRKY